MSKENELLMETAHVRELARTSGLLLDNDEILVIYQNVRYTLNQKYEVLTKMKATDFEKRMFKASIPLHGRRPGEYPISFTQRDPLYETMINKYLDVISEKTKALVQPYTDGILSALPEWRRKNSDICRK